ncbi:MAG TPA: amino acid adenylation domain-containing protein, partial [Methylocella sp.]|nr:amino acid adenylation domain-containing protein [Methylocella sp.]
MMLKSEAVGFPLSQQQRRLWRIFDGQHSQLRPLRFTIRIEGDLEVARLQHAWLRVVERHESLRTRFEQLAGMLLPVQVIGEGSRIGELRDLSQLSLKDPGECAQVIDSIEKEAHFSDLEGSPLYAQLVRFSGELHYLITALSPLCCDQLSAQNFIAEIAASYCNGFEPAGGEDPLQYADYAAWQEDILSGGFEEAKTYWAAHQDASGPVPRLPLEMPDGGSKVFLPGKVSLLIARDTLASARILTEKHHCTLESLMLAAWVTLLHRHANIPQMQLTYLSDGRSEPSATAVGAYERPLPLRCAINAKDSLIALARRLNEILEDHRDWQDYLEDGSDQAGDGARPNLSPGFGYCHALTWLQAGRVLLKIEEFPAPSGTYRLNLQCLAHEDGMIAEFHYDTARFSQAAVKCIAGQLQFLIQGALLRPEAQIAQISLTSAPERKQVVSFAGGFAVPASASPQAAGLHELMERQAVLAPGAIALRHGDASWTYGELNCRANLLAARLLSLGLKAEDRVGLLIQNPLQMVLGIFAALKAGAAYVPLDPSYPRERLIWMMQDAALAFIIAEPGHASIAESSPARAIYLEGETGREEADKETARPAIRILPDQLAYLIYTSGSTGRPKGVAISHRAALCSTLSRHSAYEAPVQGFLLLSSFSFDSSVAGLFWTLSQGGCLCLPTAGEMQDPAALARLVKQYELSHLLCLPSLYAVLLEQDRESLRSLRAAIVAGESCLPGLPAMHYERLPWARLYNEYGPTEAAVWSTVLNVAPEFMHDPVSIGRPIEGVRVYLLDEQLEPVPRGVAGEIYIGGNGLARGYFRAPGVTGGRFLPNPFGPPGSRLYRTGDLARWRINGEIEFLGRADQQVKIRGYRIELGEIEARLSVLPGINACAVIIREDQPGDRRLTAYIVPAGKETDIETLRGRLRQSLPDYMVPSVWVTLEDLPKNSNGKLDRARLPAPVQKPQSRLGPRNETEAALAGIWKELLKADVIGIEDNFFELGGDSILSIQMVGRARQRGLKVTARQLFDHQTIAALATVVTPLLPQAHEAAAEGSIPLTPIQRWFFDLGYARPGRWCHSIILTLREPLAIPAMEAALTAVLRHHDALRMCFVRDESGWHQFAAPQLPKASLERIELTAMSAAERIAEIKRIASQGQEIDLGSGEMLRAAFANAPGGGPDYLIVTMSHLVADGVSWRILLEDLERAYTQARAGEEISLPPPTSSYAEWPQNLRHYAQTDTVQAEANQWIAWLQGAETSIPADNIAGDRLERASISHQVQLDEAETEALLHRASVAYRAGAEDFLLTALTLTLGRWIGSGSVLIDIDSHGREPLFENVDLTRTVGWFTSVSPHRLSANPSAPPAASLKSIKEQMRKAPHGGLHYGLLRYLDEEGRTATALKDLPQAQVLFNYMGQLDISFSGSAFSLLDGEAYGGRDPDWQRPYELSINADVFSGRLRMTWDYSSARYSRETIEKLAQSCLATLKALIQHCLSPGAGGYTPSDFPLCGLDQAQLDQLLGSMRGISDVYPMTPLQQGILFHSLCAPRSGIYVEQLSCILEGKLDKTAFMDAWRLVVSAHPILRTAFVWEGAGRPLQVVHGEVALPIEEQDWRDVPAGDQEKRWKAFLDSDREEGFDFAHPPLMRLALMRCGEDRWFFLWSHHHVLLDGWSGPLVLKDVFTAYRALSAGEPVRLSARRPFRNYLAWLSTQDSKRAEDFWRRTLAGFVRLTPLPFQARPEKVSPESRMKHAELALTLPAWLTRAMEDFARREKITLNTLVQGAWAILLSRLSGERDVLFGVTVSGRPAELDGVEAMAGLFINTLPLRVQAEPHAKLAGWLRNLLRHNMALREHEHAALVDIQRWSEIPAGEPLFESLLAFENYPLDAALREESGPIGVHDVRFGEQTHYPLTIVAFPGPQLSFNISYDCGRFTPDSVSRLVSHYVSILEWIVGAPEACVGDVQLLGGEERRHQLFGW